LPRAHQGLRVDAPRAVVVPEHVRVLDELAGRDHLLEAGPRDEIIVDAVALPRPGRTRGVAARHDQVRDDLDETLDDSGLSSAGRGRHHVQAAAAVDRAVIRHSGPARASSPARPWPARRAPTPWCPRPWRLLYSPRDSSPAAGSPG